MNEAVKLCVECVHVHVDERGRATKCGHNICTDEVTGEPKEYCSTMRARYCVCGPDGKLWQLAADAPENQ